MCNHNQQYDQLHQDLKDLRYELKNFAQITIALADLTDRVSALEGNMDKQRMALNQYIEAISKDVNDRLSKLEQ